MAGTGKAWSQDCEDAIKKAHEKLENDPSLKEVTFETPKGERLRMERVNPGFSFIKKNETFRYNGCPVLKLPPIPKINKKNKRK